MSLSSYILDQLIPNIQMLPQHAHTFQILQNHRLHGLMSVDSLNMNDHFRTAMKTHPAFTMNDQLTLKKIDVATQWSLPMSTPQNVQMPDNAQTNSTIAANNSAVNILCVTNRMS